jgi:hypothetical protein
MASLPIKPFHPHVAARSRPSAYLQRPCTFALSVCFWQNRGQHLFALSRIRTAYQAAQDLANFDLGGRDQGRRQGRLYKLGFIVPEDVALQVKNPWAGVLPDRETRCRRRPWV